MQRLHHEPCVPSCHADVLLGRNGGAVGFSLFHLCVACGGGSGALTAACRPGFEAVNTAALEKIAATWREMVGNVSL